MTSTIIYEGPSLIDNKPIVVIYQPQGRNPKIGDMAQTWILRSDIDPITANRTGGDYSICGNCPHKGIIDPQKKQGMASVPAMLTLWPRYQFIKHTRRAIIKNLTTEITCTRWQC